jgi:single-stranded-DNA-specific exonuclease
LFDGEFEVVKHRTVGEKHLKLSLRPEGGDRLLDAVIFNADDQGWPYGAKRVAIAYRLDVNLYQNRQTLQLMVEHVLGDGG